MKVCVSSKGKTMDSELDQRFGRCSYFIIVDTENKEFKVLENEGNFSAHGAGIAAAQQVVNEGVDVVITGNVGPNSMNVLKSSNIEILRGEMSTIEKNIELLKENKLETIMKPGKSHMGL